MKKGILYAAVLAVQIILAWACPALADEAQPLRVMRVEHYGFVYPDLNWIPVSVYFNKSLTGPGGPEDYVVVFDRDGDVSTQSDWVRLKAQDPALRSAGEQDPGMTEVSLNIHDFVPNNGGRFLVRVRDTITAADGSRLDPRYCFGATAKVWVCQPGELKLQRVRCLGRDPAYPNAVLLVADFNQPVLGTPGKLRVTYDQDGDLSTTGDIKEPRVTGAGDYPGSFEALATHSYLRLETDSLRPGGRFIVRCTPGLASADGDPLDPATAVYVTDTVRDWGIPRAVMHQKFTDVPGDLVNYLDVQVYALYLQGIIFGAGERHFGPSGHITRAELATVLDRVLRRDAARYGIAGPVSGQPFADVPEGAWYREAVERVAAAGIMDGRDENRFGPEEKATREDLLAAVGCLISRQPGSWPFAGADHTAYLSEHLSDWHLISPRAREGVAFSLWRSCYPEDAGGGNLDPQRLATRADLVQVLHKHVFESHWTARDTERQAEVAAWTGPLP